jgi:hypothetical protein
VKRDGGDVIVVFGVGGAVRKAIGGGRAERRSEPGRDGGEDGSEKRHDGVEGVSGFHRGMMAGGVGQRLSEAEEILKNFGIINGTFLPSSSTNRRWKYKVYCVNSSSLPADSSSPVGVGWAGRLLRAIKMGLVLFFLAGIIVALGCLYLCLTGSSRLARRSEPPAGPGPSVTPCRELTG